MKVVCVGRNYAKHARELKNSVPDEPILFIKPDSSILQKRNAFYIPPFSNDVHHEIELVVRINKMAKHVQKKFAHKYYDEIGLGIDFTARDLQTELKDKGLPWEKAKSFDGACVVGNFVRKSLFQNVQDVKFKLEKNGQAVQMGSSGDMIFDIDTLISVISRYFTLKIGDLIFTGTPEGVGPVKAGDKLVGFLEGEKNFSVNIK
ncbi:MAG TPA: 2-hydroxyhepta-2,4-diene-1,7-dioate isomerase [Flavobacteriales bacterium]|nr:2-hydroxyhepta-2,4-diene-1,7-dioate isomerase [Flavobacteriales bacterium]